MTDSKVRPAEDVVVDVVRSWNEADYWNVCQDHAREHIEADRAAVRAEADAAGYQRAVGEILTLLEEESDSWAYAQHQLLPHGQGSQDECNRLLRLIRRRFGGEG
jgi:hypothetical protein